MKLQLNMADKIDVSFEVEWYVARYPDVRASGMDPLEHYLWLGRRLNRLPAPPVGWSAASLPHSAGAEPQQVAEHSLQVVPKRGPYSEEQVMAALRQLCLWLASKSGNTERQADAILQELRWDFGHSHDDGRTTLNPLACKLVDFLAGYHNRPDASNPFALSVGQGMTRRILLASYYAPTLAHAGGGRLLDTYRLIRKYCPQVSLTLFAPQHEGVDGDLTILDEVFDEIIYCRSEQFRADWLIDRLGHRSFDLIDLQFHQAGEMATQLKPLANRMMFTPMETLSRSAFDEIATSIAAGDLQRPKMYELIHEGAREAQIMSNVDLTICVSEADAAFLARVSGNNAVNYYPTGLSFIEFSRELAADYQPPAVASKQRRLVFAAYFGSETNRAGLAWFLKDVHPKIVKAVPGYDLAVVGRGDTSSLESLADKSVHFIGEVPNLSPVLEQAMCGLVLALSGSGFRGKINQYALCGVPAISTSLGATGLSYLDGEDIAIADGADAFAQACIDLLMDEKRVERMAAAARRRALHHYSWDAIWPRVAALYDLPTNGRNVGTDHG